MHAMLACLTISSVLVAPNTAWGGTNNGPTGIGGSFFRSISTRWPRTTPTHRLGSHSKPPPSHGAPLPSAARSVASAGRGTLLSRSVLRGHGRRRGLYSIEINLGFKRDGHFGRVTIGSPEAPPIRNRRRHLEMRRHPGELQLLVGERALRLAQSAVRTPKFLLGGIQPVPERFVTRLKGNDRGGLVAKLSPEAINGVPPSAEFR